MLNRFQAAAFVASEIALMTIFGAAVLLGFGVLNAMANGTHFGGVTLSDLRISLLLAASFMLLSGYVVSVALLFVFLGRRQSWVVRAAINSLAFLAHFMVFKLFFAELPLSVSWNDLLPVALGLTSVVAADGTVSLLWRGAIQRHSSN